MVKHCLPRIICFCDVIFFLVFLFFELLKFLLGFTALASILSLLLDHVIYLFENFLFLFIEFLQLAIKLLDFSIHALQVELQILELILKVTLLLAILFNKFFDALNNFVV